jgi:NMD protein affecting ribosome stability and mRNA decay
MSMQKRRSHRHLQLATRALVQRRGVPVEVERVVCPTCGRVLQERALRRAAA